MKTCRRKFTTGHPIRYLAAAGMWMALSGTSMAQEQDVDQCKDMQAQVAAVRQQYDPTKDTQGLRQLGDASDTAFREYRACLEQQRGQTFSADSCVVPRNNYNKTAMELSNLQAQVNQVNNVRSTQIQTILLAHPDCR